MSISGGVKELDLASDSPPETALDSLERGDERYTYVRELGRGAMGAVFLVRDRETGEQLGRIVGGDEGKALCRSSTSFLQTNGVPDPLGYLHGYWPELREL